MSNDDHYPVGMKFVITYSDNRTREIVTRNPRSIRETLLFIGEVAKQNEEVRWHMARDARTLCALCGGQATRSCSVTGCEYRLCAQCNHQHDNVNRNPRIVEKIGDDFDALFIDHK